MTVKELAKKAHCSASWIYHIARELDRLPTLEEVLARKNKVGRPNKYIKQEKEN